MIEPHGLVLNFRKVMKYVKTQWPEVEWVHNFAVLGAYDYPDIFRASDMETAFKFSALIRTLGHAQTEVWPATEWGRFKDLIRHLPAT